MTPSPAPPEPSDSPKAAPAPRGRKPGWRARVFTDLTDLSVEDFSFVRAVVGGMTETAAFRRFYGLRDLDAEGNPILPHGHTINGLARKLQTQIIEAARGSDDAKVKAAGDALAVEATASTVVEAVKVEAHMSFQAWFDSLPVDMYGEEEAYAHYEDYLAEQGIQPAVAARQVEVITEAMTIKQKVEALNFLQTYLATAPHPKTPISVWLSPLMNKRFQALQLGDMGGLCRFIGYHGRHWHRQVPGLGPELAHRLEAWLDLHAASLGLIPRGGRAWTPSPPLQSRIAPLVAAPTTVALVYESGSHIATPADVGRVRSTGIVPLELLLVPPALDGRHGMYRTQTPNHLGARDDYDAVRLWLATFLNAGKARTFDAYRREIERFYVWCLQEANVALSSVSLAHAMAYQAFLKDIPAHYITQARVTRDDPRWRPWRGQLDPRSQAYALGIVSQMFAALIQNSYVTGNPFASLKTASTHSRTMDTTRSLTDADLVWLRESLSALPGLESKDPTKAAIARRTQLILHLLLTTGMRLDEVASGTIGAMRPALVLGQEQADMWMLPVMGKGKKERNIPISESVRQMILSHQADAAVMRALSDDQSTQARLKALKENSPLICALASPVRAGSRLIDDDAQMAHDNGALGRTGLYRTLKAFIRASAKRGATAAHKSLTSHQVKLAAIEAGELVGDPVALRRITRSLETELAMWTRRSKVSTHWMRHTFALAVLRANPDDAGLKMAQQLLGHASINTTAEYVKQDESGKVSAARLVNPLGA